MFKCVSFSCPKDPSKCVTCSSWTDTHIQIDTKVKTEDNLPGFFLQIFLQPIIKERSKTHPCLDDNQPFLMLRKEVYLAFRLSDVEVTWQPSVWTAMPAPTNVRSVSAKLHARCAI